MAQRLLELYISEDARDGVPYIIEAHPVKSQSFRCRDLSHQGGTAANLVGGRPGEEGIGDRDPNRGCFS